jgi:hypothetical protein
VRALLIAILAAKTLSVSNTGGGSLDWTVIPNEDFDAVGLSAWETFVAANEPTLIRMREAFAVPSCAKEIVGTSDVTTFRSLVRALAIEGKVASADQRFGDAMNSYLDMIRLATPLLQGGGVVHESIANALIGVGLGSIVEILSHLNDTEVVYGYRYRMALAESGSPIQGYDQARWVDRLRHRRGNVKRLLDQIRVARASNLELLAQSPRRVWPKRYGMHSERGKETVRRTVELIAGHDLNHLSQIQAIRKKYGW